MISLSRQFWGHQPLRTATQAHFLNVGGNPVLFDEGAQQLIDPNDSSEAVWVAIGVAQIIAGAAGLLGEGDSLAEVSEHLPVAAAQGLETALRRSAAPAAGAEAPTRVGLSWSGFRVGLTLSGAIDAGPLREVFAAHLSTEAADHRHEIREMGGLIVIDESNRGGCARAPQGSIPEVKARRKALSDVTSQARIGRPCFSDSRDGRRVVEGFAP